MSINVLILGGTTEARELAERLGDDRRFAVTLSLAGRTRVPGRHPVPVRVGGFGGADGLAAYLRDRKTDILVDATHPFAAAISANALTATRATGVPLLVLRRHAWQPTQGDRWTQVNSIAEAVKAIGNEPKRVFVTTGRQDLMPLQSAPQHSYLVRSVDPVEPAPDLPDIRYLLDRGPFNEEAERALMERERIDTLLAKNSGGHATYGKIAAARDLGIPVIMVRRPEVPAGPVASSVAEAAAMIADHFALSMEERGA